MKGLSASRKLSLRWLLMIAVAAWLFGPVTGASAGEGNLGNTLYLKYCGSCHGADGKGNGVLASLMNPRPTDLTKLTKKSGAAFPFYDVVKAIDGQQTVRAHGDADMPVWGEMFRVEEGLSPDAQAQARGKVVLIADYLSTIQQHK